MMATSHWDDLPNDIKHLVMTKRTRLYFQDCINELHAIQVKKLKCIDAMVAIADIVNDDIYEHMQDYLYNEFRRKPHIMDIIRLLFKGASSKYIVDEHYYSLCTLEYIHQFISNFDPDVEIDWI